LYGRPVGKLLGRSQKYLTALSCNSFTLSFSDNVSSTSFKVQKSTVHHARAVYIFGNSPLAAPYPELGMTLTAASRPQIVPHILS